MEDGFIFILRKFLQKCIFYEKRKKIKKGRWFPFLFLQKVFKERFFTKRENSISKNGG
jgi:hypothetical protein